MPRPDYAALTFPPPPEERPYVIVNMVMSADGKAVVVDTEQGLGSKDDQRLMRELRVHADVVLNGASTLRTSGASPRLGGLAELEALRAVRGKSRFATAAVLSATGDLPLDRQFFTADDFDAVIYLSAAAPAVSRAAIEATGRTVITVPAGAEIPALLRHAREALSAKVLLLEGGPSLNADFFAAALVDEYFVTVGPVIVGGRDTISPVEGAKAFAADALPRMKLLSAAANEATGEVYLHYRILR